MRVMSVNIGRSVVLVRFGRRYSTAINKQPVEGPVALGKTGFAGDRPSDNRHHGGEDKAVCCYAHEHYPHFSDKLGAAELAVPSFGENLTTRGLLEDEVCIGDTFRIGEATVQVSQPREPCAKLAMKHGTPEMIRWVLATGFTGFYLRVVETGCVAAGDAIELLDRPHAGATVAATTHAMFDSDPPRDGLAVLVEVGALTAGWRRRLTARRDALDAGRPVPAGGFDP